MRKIIIYLKKKIFKTEIVFLFLLLVGFFCILPPTFNYADQSSYGLVFQKNLISYIKIKKGYKGNFNEYFEDRYKAFHQEKLQYPDAGSTYGLDPKGKVDWIMNPTHFSVFILSGLSQLTIYFLSFGRLDIETCLMVFGLIIFILSYLYAYKLGRLLSDRRFGLILAVVATSSIYFNQLVRSMLFPFLTLYPLLFFASFYYLLLAHSIKNKSRPLSLLGLAIALAVCFLNGYPNTNAMLLGVLAIFSLILAVYVKCVKPSRFKLLRWHEYEFVILNTLLFVFLLSAIWSNFLGRGILYGIDTILHDRVWGTILLQKSLSALKATNKLTFRQILGTFKTVLEVLFVPKDRSAVVGGIHEASFLQDLGFFNIIESAMFILGVIFAFKNILSKKLINYFLLVLGGFFVYRVVTNPVNASIVGRYTYDFYFVTIFFAAYGLSQLIELPFFKKVFFLKNRNDINKILYLILTILLFWNVSVFNNNFVWLTDERLFQFSGLYRLRNLYRNEISKDKNLLVYDYSLLPHGYFYHIDLISLLEDRVDYEVFNKFFSPNKIDSHESFKLFIQNMPYENLYLVIPTATKYNFQFSPEKSPEAPYLSQYKPYLVIKNRRGLSTFWVYKFAKSQENMNKK